MFDIDEYLDDIRIKEFEPSNSLVQRTKKECEKNMKPQKATRSYRSEKSHKFSKGAFIAIPAAAMLLVGVFLGALFFGEKTDPSVVAFYTVDINPSICVNVDENEVVQSVKSQNEDAKKLLANIDCVGLSVPQVIRMIIDEAKLAGYLDGNQKYVLIGRFGEGNKQALNNLQSQLEAKIGDMIDLLIVSGTFEDKLDADGLNVSAGLLALSKMADGVEITGDEKVGEVVQEVNNTNQEKYLAPTLEAGASTSGVVLEWDELDFEKMGYTGKISYHIMAGIKEDDIKSFDATKIGKLDFMSTDEQPTRFFVDKQTCGVNGENYKYYGIYAVYSGDIYVQSNVVYAVVPGPSESPTPSPSETPAPSPSETPAPEEKMVSGYVDGEYVKLSWDKNSREGFCGYKIVASKTNENPSYPEDGYLKYITDVNTTSKSLYEGYTGLKANTYYYFSVTYLYSDGSRVIGNSVRLKVPEKEETPAPTPTPGGDMVSTTITGSIVDKTVTVSWDKITHANFAGYKVVYSYLDSTPVYGESNVYYTYITDANVTSKVYSDITALKDYSSGATCYFSVTVLYSDPSTKKPGNVVSFVAPESNPYPSTNISVSLSGNNVAASWAEITDARLVGYKVVASFTDSSPSYPENGYATWITDTTVTGYTISESYIKGLDGYAPGATCYFAITAVYEATKETGNVDSLAYPY